MSQRRPHPIAIAALCFALSGCGGEQANGLSRRQLVRRAQAICLRAQSAAGAMLPPPRQAGLAGTARYLAKSASIAEARTNELKGLKVRPTGRVASRFKRVITAEEDFTFHLQSLAAAAASGDVRTLQLVEADTGPEQRLISRAAKLRIALCAP